MAEVPPHLLDRSRARRAALSGGTVEAGAPAVAAPAAVPAKAESAAPVAAAAAPTGGAPAEPTYIAPPPPKGAGFAKMGSVFFLVALPVWAFFSLASFQKPKSTVETPESRGAALYAANCVACHGPDGAGSDKGGVGRPLWNGNAEQTFPDPLEQVAFVKHGSCGVGIAYGNPKREGGQHKGKGGMPAFGGVLTDQQILDVITYERSVLSGKPYPVNQYAKVGEDGMAAPAMPPAELTGVSTDKVCAA